MLCTQLQNMAHKNVSKKSNLEELMYVEVMIKGFVIVIVHFEK